MQLNFEITTAKERDEAIEKLQELRVIEECKNNRWYWSCHKAMKDKTYLFCYQKDKDFSYGFDWAMDWSNELRIGEDTPVGVPATKVEIIEALKSEVSKRYSVGDFIKCAGEPDDFAYLSEGFMEQLNIVALNCGGMVCDSKSQLTLFLDGVFAESKKRLKKGDWYEVEANNKEGSLVPQKGILRYNGGGKAYGFYMGDYGTNWDFPSDSLETGFAKKLLTDAQVIEVFKKEVIKKKYHKKDFTPIMSFYRQSKDCQPDRVIVDLDPDKFRIILQGKCDLRLNKVVFLNGKWAEVVDEPKYKLGQRHSLNGVEYILCAPEAKSINLINLNTGNRWTNAVKVDNPDKLTHDDFIKLTNEYHFEIVK